ncbi:class I SAM-dependent methyltransferase [Kitasatospora camelliae]|uniref:Class I SAM-dependent methyltransferase n=1 Tax=Kitasatospora camelliae TaxID=3156397 RepID=A0AAU8JR98_9ACTN
MREHRLDAWDAGDAYDRFMGRWSRLVADEFIAWLDAGAGLRWLDVGCGTGALTAAVADRCRPRLILGVDRSEGFVTAAVTATPAPAVFAVADALSLPVRDRACDVAVSGLALNFVPEPATAVAEAARTVKPGGVVAAYVWDYSQGMAFLRFFWDTAVSVDPSAAPLDEGRRFSVCRPDRLRALWTGAGLTEVALDAIDVSTDFADFDEFWAPFLSGQGPAPGYVTTLAPAARVLLRDTLHRTAPTRPDGSITFTARAWAIRGRRTDD